VGVGVGGAAGGAAGGRREGGGGGGAGRAGGVQTKLLECSRSCHKQRRVRRVKGKAPGT
jgi:hypothetical protein